jgi:hypothetical protein
MTFLELQIDSIGIKGAHGPKESGPGQGPGPPSLGPARPDDFSLWPGPGLGPKAGVIKFFQKNFLGKIFFQKKFFRNSLINIPSK